MRLNVLWPLAALIAAGSPAAAQNDKVLTGPEPDWVEASEPLAVPADAAGLFFVRRQDTLVHLDGDGEAFYIGQRLKLLHPQALEAGNIALTWNPAAGAPIVHGLLVHRDGEVIDVLANSRFEVLRRENQLEQAMLDGLLTAVLRVPDLRVGDELEWAYTTRSKDPTLGNDSFGLLSFAHAPPAGRFRLGLSWEAGQEPKIRLTPDFAGLAQRKPGALDVRLEEPATLDPPKDAPPRYSWQRIVEYSDFASWAAISQRFHRLYTEAAQLGPGSPVRQEAARIAAAHSDQLARAHAALELVQQQVRYIYVGLDGGNLDPASADETWQRRYGDCKGKTTLLLALLIELGIEAEAVLANNSGMDDGFDARLPSPGLFDHILVRARIGGKTYWMDGTFPAVARAGAEPFVPYRWVLPLAAKGRGLEAVAWKPVVRPDEMALFEIDARAGFDAPARIVQTTIQRGIKGLAQYVQFSALTKSQIEGAFRSNLSGGTWDTIESVDYRYDPATRASVLTITGTGPVDWDDDGGGARSLTLPGGGFNPPGRRQRAGEQDQEAPFYNEPSFDCRVTSVRLPSDTDPQDWWFNSWFDTKIFGKVYYRAFERRDDTIRMVRGHLVEEREITPAKAARDNNRLPDFDNSMASIIYVPNQAASPQTDTPIPATWEIDWIANPAPCLPPDLRG